MPLIFLPRTKCFTQYIYLLKVFLRKWFKLLVSHTWVHVLEKDFCRYHVTILNHRFLELSPRHFDNVLNAPLKKSIQFIFRCASFSFSLVTFWVDWIVLGRVPMNTSIIFFEFEMLTPLKLVVTPTHYFKT